MTDAYQSARTLYEREHYREALPFAQQAVEQQPDSVDALVLLSRILGALHRSEEKLRMIERALELEPHNPVALAVKAQALMATKRAPEAQQTVEASLSVDPSCALAHRIKADILAATGRVDSALAEFDAALALSPDVETLCDKSNVLVLLGHNEEAEYVARAAVALAPESSDAHMCLAAALVRTNGSEREAIDEAERALALSSENAMAWAVKGWGLGSLGQYAESVQAFDRALELDPDNQGFKDGRAESARFRDANKRKSWWRR